VCVRVCGDDFVPFRSVSVFVSFRLMDVTSLPFPLSPSDGRNFPIALCPIAQYPLPLPLPIAMPCHAMMKKQQNASSRTPVAAKRNPVDRSPLPSPS
jgi:hypothetical protein